MEPVPEGGENERGKQRLAFLLLGRPGGAAESVRGRDL